MRKHARNGRRNGYRKAVTEAGEEVNLIKQMDNIEAFEVACTDFTELSYDSGRLQVKLIPIVGYRCKMIYGWALGRRGDTNLAMEALEEMTGTLKKLGMRPEGMIIHHDQDAVFTGSRWADHLLHELEMQVSYSANGAKENTVMESTIGHFKGEALHLFQEATSLEELEKLVENQVTYWNQERMHSSIGYQTPEEFVENSSR